MKDSLIIGARGSKLSLIQAETVKRAILAVRPKIQIEIQIIKTEGDVNSNPIPLDVVGKGWFTKEIEECLLNKSIDIAVHSLKDLPELLPPGLRIACYLEREDARDALVSNGNLKLAELPAGAVIGTDSLRRKAQILKMRSDVTVSSIRGNVPSRIEKLSSGYDAVVLAAAGLKRLNLEDRIAQYFTIEEMMPAPGQGVLAIEIREDDTELSQLMTSINNSEVEMCALAERAFSKNVDGGCKTPTAAYAVLNGEEITLHGMLAHEDGSHITSDSIQGDAKDGVALGIKLAKQMLEKEN